MWLTSLVTYTDDGGTPPDWSDAARAESRARADIKRGLRFLIAAGHGLLAFVILVLVGDILFSVAPRLTVLVARSLLAVCVGLGVYGGYWVRRGRKQLRI